MSLENVKVGDRVTIWHRAAIGFPAYPPVFREVTRANGNYVQTDNGEKWSRGSGCQYGSSRRDYFATAFKKADIAEGNKIGARFTAHKNRERVTYCRTWENVSDVKIARICEILDATDQAIAKGGE